MRSSQTTEEDAQNIRVQLGLDKSQPEQYWIFVTSLIRGDLGDSLIKRKPVTEMIMAALPNSFKLVLASFGLSMLTALLLGVLGATRRDTWLDNGVKFIAILGQAVPNFWLAIVAIYIFSVVLEILPTSGTGSLAHFVLPVGTLAFWILPGIMRLIRSSMLDVLDSEYIKLARIKGLPERVIIWKHALRNALIAPLTTAGMLLAGMVGGAVITENIFNWPGMGRLMLEATYARDFPVVQSITLLIAVIVLGMNLLVDITYAYVDPQIRYQKS